MTEEEARKKWCPYATAHWCNDCQENKDACCIASECMMWRWEKGTAAVNGVLHEKVQLDIGYCGLSIKP